MPFVSPNAQDFSGSVFDNYQKAVYRQNWSSELDFALPSSLPLWKQDLSFAVAAQACHAEHLGMCTASQLVLEAPTSQLRYAFAAAAQDEATHSEVLGRYALARGGSLEEANAHHSGMVDQLLGEHLSYEERSTLHTMLEGFALDQFKTFVIAFDGDLLSTIYRHIRQDEARHVGLGLMALTGSGNRSVSSSFDLARVEEIARKLGGLGEDLFEWLGTIEMVPKSIIRARYEKNHNHRINEIRVAMEKRT